MSLPLQSERLVHGRSRGKVEHQMDMAEFAVLAIRQTGVWPLERVFGEKWNTRWTLQEVLTAPKTISCLEFTGRVYDARDQVMDGFEGLCLDCINIQLSPTKPLLHVFSPRLHRQSIHARYQVLDSFEGLCSDCINIRLSPTKSLMHELLSRFHWHDLRCRFGIVDSISRQNPRDQELENRYRAGSHINDPTCVYTPISTEIEVQDGTSAPTRMSQLPNTNIVLSDAVAKKFEASLETLTPATSQTESVSAPLHFLLTHMLDHWNINASRSSTAAEYKHVYMSWTPRKGSDNFENVRTTYSTHNSKHMT